MSLTDVTDESRLQEKKPGTKRNRRKNRFCRLLAVLLAVCMLCDVPVTETVLAAKKTTSTSSKRKWVKTKKGFWTYYRNGKKLKSLQTIKEKKYYFDSNGIQRSGWRQIGNSYYFFRQGHAATAYMMTNTTVNGIKLNKNGKAVLKTSRDKRKVKVMCSAQTIVDDLTKNCKTKSRFYKLRVVYDWTQKNSVIAKTNIGSFHSSDKNWDLYYAERLFGTTTRPIKGDCYTYASIFGYLANALGYTVTICSTGHHGFTRIGNKFYDASWQKARPNNDLFAQSWNAVAPGLGVRYRKGMKYTVVI